MIKESHCIRVDKSYYNMRKNKKDFYSFRFWRISKTNLFNFSSTSSKENLRGIDSTLY